MILLLLLAALTAAERSSEHTPWGSKARYSVVAGDITTHKFECKPVALYRFVFSALYTLFSLHL